MIRLKGTLTTLEAVLTSDTGNELDVVCSFGNIKFTAAELTDLDSTAQKTTGTTAITLAGPAASATETIGVEQISAYNDNGSAHTVKIQLNDGTSTFVIKSEILQPGDALVYDNGWTVEKKNNIESSSNTTTVPLQPSQEFIGPWEKIDERDVMTSVKSDAHGTLYYEFSNDAVNTDIFPTDGIPVTGGIHDFHVAEKGYRYFRLRYHNGLTAQTYFRAYTYYGAYRQPNAPLLQRMGANGDAIVVRPTIPQDEISAGRRGGVTPWGKYGYRDGINIADGDAWIIADNTTNTPEILLSPETFDIAYTPASDGLGTNGALTLQVSYLDDNGEKASAIHTLSNTGSDTTSFSGYGINRVRVASVGAATAVNQANVADITVTSTTTGGVQAFVPAGSGSTQQVLFFVPFNCTGVVKKVRVGALRIGGGSDPVVVFRGWLFDRDSGVTAEAYRADIDTGVVNFLIEEPEEQVPPGSVIWITADVSINNTDVTGRLNMNVYDNGDVAAAPAGLYPGATIAESAIGEIGIGGNS